MEGNALCVRRPAVWLAALLCCFAASCPTASAAEKLTVFASLFPQYDFAKRVAGEHAEVKLLLPPGAESHSYEPTPSDMAAIAAADLFIYTGEYMEPWAKRLADATATPGGVVVVDASAGIHLLSSENNGDHEHGGDDEDHEADHDDSREDHADGHSHALDPHIWLDPLLAIDMADTIANAFVERDPANATAYQANAAILKTELANLDAEFGELVANAPKKTLVFGERFAFTYFFHRYGLEYVGAYRSCAPGAEPGMKAVIGVIEYVRKNGVRFLYLEESAQPRITAVITEETGATPLKVNSLHNLTADQLASGVGFVDIMKANMDAFAKGLE